MSPDQLWTFVQTEIQISYLASTLGIQENSAGFGWPIYWYDLNLHINHNIWYDSDNTIYTNLERSLDNGETWEFLSWPQQLVGLEAIHYLDNTSFVEWDSETYDFAWSTNRGMAFSNDHGESIEWVDNGIDDVEINDIVHSNQPGLFYASSPMGLFRTSDWGHNWITLTHGFSENLNVSYANPDLIFMRPLNWGEFYRSNNGGETLELTNGIPSQELRFHNTNPETLWSFGSTFAYRSDDNGESWILKLSFDPEFITLNDLKLPRYDPSRVYVTGETGFYRSFNNGEEFEEMDVPENLIQIVCDFINPDFIYALYLSEDAGKSWTDLVDDLPFLGSQQLKEIEMSYLGDQAIYISTQEVVAQYIRDSRLYHWFGPGNAWDIVEFPSNS